MIKLKKVVAGAGIAEGW